MTGPQSLALDAPFRVDGQGRITVTRTIQREIAIRLESIIGTTPGERVMRPGYGAGAGVYVFDSNDEMMAASLASRIQDQINAMEPAVIVEKVEVEQIERLAGMMRMRVDYRLRSTGEVETAVVAVSQTATYGWPA